MDRYKAKLAHAAWTWRENKVCPYHGPAAKKDRASCRADKRSSKQKDRREIKEESGQ